MAALSLPYRGLEGGLLSRYLRIMATIMPSSSIMGLEGGLLSPICGHYGDDHGDILRHHFMFKRIILLTRHIYIKLEKKKNKIRASVFIFAAHQVPSHVPV